MDDLVLEWGEIRVWKSVDPTDGDSWFRLTHNDRTVFSARSKYRAEVLERAVQIANHN